MKKFSLFLFILILLTSCNVTEPESIQEEVSYFSSSSLQNKNAKPISYKDFAEIEALAKGTTVNIFMWGGDSNINAFIDGFVTDNMKQLYDITVIRTPMDANVLLEKLKNEKTAEKPDGTIDVIWINGENFKIAKEGDLLLGNIDALIPNSQDYINNDIKSHDAGTPIEGLEIPWGKVKFAFSYNGEFVDNPPANFTELLEYCKENPGMFTYPSPNDFTGNGFIKELIYNLNGSGEYDKPVSDEALSKTYDYLKEIKPYLWQKGETYPNSLEELDKLYANGDVRFTMGYNEYRAKPFIDQDLFPSETKTFLMGDYTIYNCHYLSVPFNSPNKSGAILLINYLLSPEAQLEKSSLSIWGDQSVLDLDKLSDADRLKFIIHLENIEYQYETYAEEEVLDLDAETSVKIKETWEKAMFE